MSTQRLGNQKIVSSEHLNRKGVPPRRVVVEVIDDLLYEMQRKVGAGQEIAWDALRLTIEPERQHSAGLHFRASIDVHQDDFVAGFTAMALAAHEMEKGRKRDT